MPCSDAASVLYVANTDDGDISVLHWDGAAARCTTLQRIGVGGQVMPLAISADRRFLYAARRSEPLAIVALRIDSELATLSRMAEAPVPASMAFIATEALGRHVLSASYGGDLVAVTPLDVDGRPQAVQQVVPTPPKAHSIRCDPTNRFAFSTSLGGDCLLQFRFDPHSGHLTPNDPPVVALRPGSGPRHLQFHPRLDRVYLLNELDATVVVLDLDSDRGTLTVGQTLSCLAPGFALRPWGSELRLTPDGRFLYTSERSSSTIAGFSADARTGRLTPLGHWTTQTQPRSFAIDAAGGHLFVAGQLSNRLGVHRIDTRSGSLQVVAEHPLGRLPSWVET